MQIVFGRKRPLHLIENLSWQRDEKYRELQKAFRKAPRGSEEEARAEKALTDYEEANVRNLPNWKEIEEERKIAAECESQGISWETWQERKFQKDWDEMAARMEERLARAEKGVEKLNRLAEKMERLAAEIRGETNSRNAEPAAEKASTPQSPTSSPS